jgi:hypothetical protein
LVRKVEDEEDEAKKAARAARSAEIWSSVTIPPPSSVTIHHHGCSQSLIYRFGIPPKPLFLKIFEELGLRPGQIYRRDAQRRDPEPSSALQGAKVHVFALDKANFLAVKSRNVLKFFDTLQPRFVGKEGKTAVEGWWHSGPWRVHERAFLSCMSPKSEWINEVSCNVLFTDDAAAEKALEATSSPLPSKEEVEQFMPPSQSGQKKGSRKRGRGGDLVDVKGWRVGRKVLESGEDGTSVRVLLRIATQADVSADPAKAKVGVPPRARPVQNIGGSEPRVIVPRHHLYPGKDGGPHGVQGAETGSGSSRDGYGGGWGGG